MSGNHSSFRKDLINTLLSGAVLVGGFWMMAYLGPVNSGYLTRKNFENAKWLPTYNDSEGVREYLRRENVSQADANFHLYERVVREKNGNPKSLRGWILVPDLDSNGVVTKYQTPHPNDQNTGN